MKAYASMIEIGDYVRRPNGTRVGCVKSISNGKVHFFFKGKSYTDWDGVDSAVLVCKAADGPPPDWDLPSPRAVNP